MNNYHARGALRKEWHVRITTTRECNFEMRTHERTTTTRQVHFEKIDMYGLLPHASGTLKSVPMNEHHVRITTTREWNLEKRTQRQRIQPNLI